MNPSGTRTATKLKRRLAVAFLVVVAFFGLVEVLAWTNIRGERRKRAHLGDQLDDHLDWLRRTLVAEGATGDVTLVAHSFGAIGVTRLPSIRELAASAGANVVVLPVDHQGYVTSGSDPLIQLLRPSVPGQDENSDPKGRRSGQSGASQSHRAQSQ